MKRDRWIAGGLALALLVAGLGFELGRRRRRNPTKAAAKKRRWSQLRGESLNSKTREAAARRKRDAALGRARRSCAMERERVKQGCATQRTNARAEANRAIAKEKAWRAEKRDDYRFASGRARRAAEKRPSMSAAENDSLAEHNIRPDLVDLWRQLAGQFPRTLAPDHRAELFGEWVQEHPDEVLAFQAAQVTDDPDIYASGYEAYAAELQEAAPF